MQQQRPACRQTGEHAPDGRPLCHHGEPMYRFGGKWRCAVRVRERVKAYDDLHADQRRERNTRRVRVLGVHVGTVGFSASEREAMLNGSSE